MNIFYFSSIHSMEEDFSLSGYFDKYSQASFNKSFFSDSQSYQAPIMASLVVQRVKTLPAMWETQVQSLGQEDTLEKRMAIWHVAQGFQNTGSVDVAHEAFRGMWNLPRISPALAGRFLTTVPPGKSRNLPLSSKSLNLLRFVAKKDNQSISLASL